MGRDRPGRRVVPVDAARRCASARRRPGPWAARGQRGRLQGLVVGIEAVAEDVLLARLVDRRRSARRRRSRRRPSAPSGLAEGRQAVDGVVVGQGGGPDPGRGQAFGQGGRRAARRR
ncbi:MAG: hypothetical protein MZW92_10065 [Comamonadaceae bacterium]|nr:hypothetical protein [Comamonadaceae bacterium]